MIEPSRHAPLRALPWDQGAAARAIDEIVADAFDHFGGDQFWPAHPLDDGVRDGHSSIYVGAAGVTDVSLHPNSGAKADIAELRMWAGS